MHLWPLVSDFSAMLQSPRLAFREPGLRECRFERDALGQPRPWSGNFATVYKGIYPNGDFIAVRIFNRTAKERRERYQAVNEHLKGLRPRCLVNFQYHEEGIRSARDGKMYPMLTMEWVAGDTLFEWLKKACAANRSEEIRDKADRWVELVSALRLHLVAHGDIQHANVMVTEYGELKLVDYDCICVPALVGRESLELGVEPYQHPGRNAQTRLSLELDHFSGILVFVALRALAADPHLWQKHIAETTYDKILFRRSDLQHPESSELLKDFAQSPDPLVRKSVNVLCELYRMEIGRIPSLIRLLSPGGHTKAHAAQETKAWIAEAPLQHAEQRKASIAVSKPEPLPTQSAPVPQESGGFSGSISNDWYFSARQKEYGPFSLGLLVQFVQEGRISPETRVRKGARGDWVLARHSRDLARFLAGGTEPASFSP